MTEPTGIPLEAYRQTDFIAVHTGGEVVVRLDEPSAELDRLLAELNATSGIFITGWNPYSEQTAPEINHAANQRMSSLFAGRGIRTLPHVGRARGGGWFENGFFALDLDPADALDIARVYEQIAVVHAPSGAPARLLLTGVTPRR